MHIWDRENIKHRTYMKPRRKGFENVQKLRTRVDRGRSRGGSWKSDILVPHNDLSEPLEIYMKWLEGRRFAEQTMYHRKNALQKFFVWAESRGLESASEVNLAVLESYQRYLGRHRKKDGKPLSSRTLRQRLTSLKDYFGWLVRHGVIGANPASELIMPRKEIRMPERALSLNQIDSLMSQPNTSDLLGLRDRAMLEVLYGAALRLGELRKLEMSDVQHRHKTLFLRQAKGKKDRVVPIGERALHWLNRYLEEARPRLEIDMSVQTVFLSGYGEGFHPNALSYLVRKYFRSCDIAKGGAHLLRHSCATHLLEGGADIRYIQRLLGHASLETTAIYTQMNVESLRQVFAACHPIEKRWNERGA